MPEQQSVLECILCHEPQTRDDILKFNFFFENGVCYKCLRRLYRLPNEVSCFGKEFSSTAIECKRICPDRKVCPLFQFGEIKEMRKDALTESERRGALDLLRHKANAPVTSRSHPFKRGSVIFSAFELCRKGCSKEQFNKLVARHQADARRLLRLFRREEAYGKRWNWREQETGYSIRYPAKR